MRIWRGICAFCALAVSVGVLAGTAAAANPIHAQATITGFWGPDVYLTIACGFDVIDSINAFTTATGWLGSNGEVVSEFDTWRGTWTYTSLASGKSVTRALAATVTTDYGSGAELGSLGVSRARGYGSGTLLGGPPGAGIYETSVQVVGFDVSGIPFAAPGAATYVQGDFSAETKEICGLLH